METFEFRLLGADQKVSPTETRQCASLQEAIDLGCKLVLGYKWVEVWYNAHALVRFPNPDTWPL